MVTLLIFLVLGIFLVISIILIVKNKTQIEKETFIANSNIPNPSIKFDYLHNPNYTSDVLNRYYINPDYKWIWGRRKYGPINHQWTYKNTDNGYNYYYGQFYNKWWGVPVSNWLYNSTGTRY